MTVSCPPLPADLSTGRIKSFKNLPVRLSYFVKLKCQRSSTKLLIGIKYFTHDLVCEVRDARSCDVCHEVLLTSALPNPYQLNTPKCTFQIEFYV